NALVALITLSTRCARTRCAGCARITLWTLTKRIRRVTCRAILTIVPRCNHGATTFHRPRTRAGNNTRSTVRTVRARIPCCNRNTITSHREIMSSRGICDSHCYRASCSILASRTSSSSFALGTCSTSSSQRIIQMVAKNVDGYFGCPTFVPKMKKVVITNRHRTGLDYLLAPVLIEKERGGILQHGVKLRNESGVLRWEKHEVTVCRPVVVARDLNGERHDAGVRQFPGAVVAGIHVAFLDSVDPFGTRRQEIVAA